MRHSIGIVHMITSSYKMKQDSGNLRLSHRTEMMPRGERLKRLFFTESPGRPAAGHKDSTDVVLQPWSSEQAKEGGIGASL